MHNYDQYQAIKKQKSEAKSDRESEAKAKHKRSTSDTILEECKKTKNVRTKILSQLDKVMVKYQKKFPEVRKLYGLGGIIRARDYFEGCHIIGWNYQDILDAIEKATVSEPWKIITLSDKKSKAYAKEWEGMVKKKTERGVDNGHHT